MLGSTNSDEVTEQLSMLRLKETRLGEIFVPPFCTVLYCTHYRRSSMDTPPLHVATTENKQPAQWNKPKCTTAGRPEERLFHRRSLEKVLQRNGVMTTRGHPCTLRVLTPTQLYGFALTSYFRRRVSFTQNQCLAKHHLWHWQNEHWNYKGTLRANTYEKPWSQWKQQKNILKYQANNPSLIF